MPPRFCKRGFQILFHGWVAYDKKRKKPLQIRKLVLRCNLCRKKFTHRFLCLALPVQIQHLAALIPAKHSQNICHRLLLLEIYGSGASCATEHARMLVKNPFWMPITCLLSIYLCTCYSYFLDLAFTSMALTHFLAQLQISLAGSGIAAHAAICQLDCNPADEVMC